MLNQTLSLYFNCMIFFFFFQRYNDPAIALSMFIFEWKCICAGFYCLFISVFVIEDLIIEKGGVGIPLTCLTLPHFCIWKRQDLDFKRHICHASLSITDVPGTIISLKWSLVPLDFKECLLYKIFMKIVQILIKSTTCK